MIFTANAFQVTTDWSVALRWPSQQFGATHLAVFTLATDVVAQIQEETGGVIFVADTPQEILLRQGFNGRDLPPFYAVRFKIWDKTALPQTPTAIDVTLT